MELARREDAPPAAGGNNCGDVSIMSGSGGEGGAAGSQQQRTADGGVGRAGWAGAAGGRPPVGPSSDEQRSPSRRLFGFACIHALEKALSGFPVMPVAFCRLLPSLRVSIVANARLTLLPSIISEHQQRSPLLSSSCSPLFCCWPPLLLIFQTQPQQR